MSEHLPENIENALQVAWDFLMGCGEIADHHQAAETLLESIRQLAMRGESRPLMLANRAIEAYRRQRRAIAA